MTELDTAPVNGSAAGRSRKTTRAADNPALSMADNAPTSMMATDREFVITYANPAAHRALARLEKHLPVRAEDIVCSSLEIFVPSFDVEAALPQSARVTFGPELVDVVISALDDADGTSIGAMVTWEIVTERVLAETAVAETAADTAAVNNVLANLGATRTVDEAVQTALDTVRRDFGWAYGSYWKVDQVDAKLKFALESGDAGEEFRQVTLAASFAEGVGLSGRAWKTRDLYFTQDIGEMTDCVRAPVAQKVGVKSGVCFPITVAGDVVGTMDFFATETLHPSEQRL
ncbi:MAG: GAF domain-containing protein, partial [Marmoricola sp.]